MLAAGSHKSQSKVGIVVLAAGASVRMGTPKQLLVYQGQTLIRRAVETALASLCSPIVVVIGANSELVENELKELPVLVVANREWRQGMGSSIRVGFERLVSSDATLQGVVFMLCDQPFITAAVINELVHAHEVTRQDVIAAEYRGIRGVPALFSRQLFAEILALDVKEGAKQIIRNHSEGVATISVSEAAVDIDTPGDYENLMRRHGELHRARDDNFFARSGKNSECLI
jgi:molybdenum cofactor cytidylyltransferase